MTLRLTFTSKASLEVKCGGGFLFDLAWPREFPGAIALVGLGALTGPRRS